MIDFNQQVDKRSIFLLFGCYCINPKLSLDEQYSTNENDYPELFHKMIWGAIVNIAKKGMVEKITPLDIETEITPFETAINLWKNNNGYDYIDKAILLATDKVVNIGKYFDDVRKFSILRNASENLKLNTLFLYDESNDTILEKFNKMNSMDVLNEITNKFLNFKSMWKNQFGDNYSFKIGDDIKDRLEEHKNQQDTFGYPFQSAYLTTVFRGMRKKKYILRSSTSGGGKSRSALADACNICSDRIYDWNKKQWVSTGSKESVLFISTELEKEEIQDVLLAHVSGVEQDKIESYNINEEESKILEESVEYMKEYRFFVEYMPDFTIDLISETIERYCINHNITACFFDYINDSPSLYQYYYEKTHTNLRSDQILSLFSTALKSVCNKFNIYLGSSTQLNDSYKDKNNKDASALKGSKAIVEKTDGAMLVLPVTHSDLKKLKPIIEKSGQFGIQVPNMSYYVFKNRGGKWKAIVIWTKLNMGTMRETDCFVTDYNFELITDIEKTIIDFQFEDVGDTDLIEQEISDDFTGADLANELSR